VVDRVDLEMQLPRAETASAVARHALRRSYARSVDPLVLGDAELLASELASNAVRHGRGAIMLRACLDDDRLLVEVVDEGSGFERALRRHDFGQVGGWGLDIVDEVADRWGVHEGTTRVWFELEPRDRRAREDLAARGSGSPTPPLDASLA
jgi:anti-sigma regulatory factor (Ser/Thr protein kinase)